MIGLDDFGEQADDAARGIKLAALLALGAGKLAEKVFIDAAEGVVINGGGYLGDLLE